MTPWLTWILYTEEDPLFQCELSTDEISDKKLWSDYSTCLCAEHMAGVLCIIWSLWAEGPGETSQSSCNSGADTQTYLMWKQSCFCQAQWPWGEREKHQIFHKLKLLKSVLFHHLLNGHNNIYYLRNIKVFKDRIIIIL